MQTLLLNGCAIFEALVAAIAGKTTLRTIMFNSSFISFSQPSYSQSDLKP